MTASNPCLKPLAERPETAREGTDNPTQRKRDRKLADVKKYAPRFYTRFQRAYGGKSLRSAVDAQCCECMGYEVPEIARCTAPACPLYPYRPRGGGKVKGRTP